MLMIKATRDAILRPLQTVAGIVERRHTLPILANVLLSAKGGRLAVTATDGYIVNKKAFASLPKEFQNKIFDRFYQVDNLISRKFGGTGLGLSICKAYVELMGGRMWLKSKPGEGADFRFTLPKKPKEDHEKGI